MPINEVPAFDSRKDPLSEKREENALRKFKQVLQDMILLLRQSTGMDTVCLYWVNHMREQFVLESKATKWSNTIFQDRVPFENFYLNKFKDVSEPIVLEVGRHIQKEDLVHYYDFVPVTHVTILPFINNGETVAMTVMESERDTMTANEEESTIAYMDAIGNLLHTFLELSDLSDRQTQWIQYEEMLNKTSYRMSNVKIINHTISAMQQCVSNGGVILASQGMDSWHSLMNSVGAKNAPVVGLPLDKNTIAYDALQSGKPEFTIHFNGNPKRISLKEQVCNGASLAIPLLLKDRRNAVFIAYDENPLVFKESNKHKLINLVRLAALQIAAGYDSPDSESNLMTNEYTAYKMDYWESVLESELKRIKSDNENQLFTWFGLASPSNLSAIRTRFRLEELNNLQKNLVITLNPANYGIPGFIGYYSDYIYSFIIQSDNKNAVIDWVSGFREFFKKPYVSENGRNTEVRLQVGYTQINDKMQDVQQVIKEAKEALGQAVTNQDSMIYEYQ